MISSLSGKALRMLVELRGLPSDSTSFLIAEPGKLDIKRCKPEASSIMRALSGARCTGVRLYTL